MPCPYLKQVVMLFCDASPVKTMVPLDRIATADPCLGEFHCCPMFLERQPRLDTVPTATAPAQPEPRAA
jgi:hypothetical protein